MVGRLTLGEIIFSDFEIPEHFGIGGKQRLVIHTLPGGGRVVDAMGAEDLPIRWSGVFSGQNAPERVRLLERLRKGGQRQPFSWNAWRFSVVVQDFEAQVASSWWIPYQIQLCVLAADDTAARDWLDGTQAPALTVELPSVTALEAAIRVASLGLASSNVGQAIRAAGNLAQLATARAYGLGST